MDLIVAELARYALIFIFALYTFYSFRGVTRKTQEGKERVFRIQRSLTILFVFICNLVLIVENQDLETIAIFGAELIFYFFFVNIYQVFYKGMSKLVLNNMMMCMMVGFIMLGRLDHAYAIRQLVMAAIAMGVCLFVPFFIQRFVIWEKLGWQYAICGILLLMLVFVIGEERYGAVNWIRVGGVSLQPSEFVKIIYVFFIAATLTKVMAMRGAEDKKKECFRMICIITAVAAVHVLILVAEKDLGAALIYFITYLVVLYVATMQIGYLAAGLGGGTLAAIAAYHLFSHVQTRVIAWKDPWSNINGKAYQICRSLFAIGTGGVAGMGLGQGMPESVPVVESDFIFSGITEEFGMLFSICLILIYCSCFIMFVNIAMKMKKRFYKLCAFGLSVVFIFQVFLCIGGATKFIPSTGVTLPLISYGGSSIITTIIIFSIIQGMYVLNQKEEEAKIETLQEQQGRKKNRKAKR